MSNQCKHGHTKTEKGRCLECKKISAKAWRGKNKEKHLSAVSEWQKNNKEKMAAARAARYAANPEKYKNKSKEWAEKNKEKVAAKGKSYRERHPEKYKDYNKSRATKLRVGGKPSGDIIQRLYFLQNGLCACCGELLLNEFELDHVIPVSQGGSNTDDNLQLLKPGCNKRKSNRLPTHNPPRNDVRLFRE